MNKIDKVPVFMGLGVDGDGRRVGGQGRGDGVAGESQALSTKNHKCRPSVISTRKQSKVL